MQAADPVFSMPIWAAYNANLQSRGVTGSYEELTRFLFLTIQNLENKLSDKQDDDKIKKMDIKELKKPEEYDSEPAAFNGWYEKFTNLLRTRDHRWGNFIKMMEAQGDKRITDVVSLKASITAEYPETANKLEEFSEQLYSYLLNYTKGSLYAKVTKMQERGTLENFRDIIYKGKHLSKSKVCSLNSKILEPKRALSEKDVDKSLTEWKYDQQQLLDLKQPPLSDDMQKTILMKIVPESYLKHMRENYSKHDTYFAFEQEYFNEVADRANAAPGKSPEKSLGALETPQETEHEEIQVYSPEWDCWICGLAPKRARTGERDEDVDMTPTAPAPQPGKGLKGKGGKGKGRTVQCWGCGGPHYQSECPLGPGGGPTKAAWKSWQPPANPFVPPSASTWSSWFPKGGKGGKGKGGKGKGGKGKGGKGIGMMDMSYGPALGAMNWGGFIGSVTHTESDVQKQESNNPDLPEKLPDQKLNNPDLLKKLQNRVPNVSSGNRQMPVQTRNSFGPLENPDDDIPEAPSVIIVNLEQVAKVKTSQGDRRRTHRAARRNKEPKPVDDEAIVAINENESKKDVEGPGYVYLEDEGPCGPDRQWEALKHAASRDYVPVEDRFMSDNQKAERAGRRQRDSSRPLVRAPEPPLSESDAHESDNEDLAWLDELIMEADVAESGGQSKSPLMRCAPKLQPPPCPPQCEEGDDCGCSGFKQVPRRRRRASGLCVPRHGIIDNDAKPEEAEKTTATALFGGWICPINNAKDFKDEADRIRAICMAERVADESKPGDTVRPRSPPVLLADKPTEEPTGSCWSFGTGYPSLNELGKTPCGWQLLSMAVDSGAAETVIPHRLVMQHPIRETAASKSGMCYASATNQPIPNLGEQKLPMVTQEGTLRGMTFQAAPVSKPLGSVKRMCASNHRVVFDDDGSYIQNKATGEINWMREDNGNYMLDVWIVPPDQLSEDEQPSFARQP